jgi:hypothetical protein
MTFTTKELYDVCISCGQQTSYKKTDNITYRFGYIEGAGQLCFECGRRDASEAKLAEKLWSEMNEVVG